MARDGNFLKPSESRNSIAWFSSNTLVSFNNAELRTLMGLHNLGPARDRKSMVNRLKKHLKRLPMADTPDIFRPTTEKTTSELPSLSSASSPPHNAETHPPPAANSVSKEINAGEKPMLATSEHSAAGPDETPLKEHKEEEEEEIDIWELMPPKVDENEYGERPRPNKEQLEVLQKRIDMITAIFMKNTAAGVSYQTTFDKFARGSIVVY